MEHRLIDGAAIIEAVRAAGDELLSTFKIRSVPNDLQEFMTQFRDIEVRCLKILKTRLDLKFPDTPWASGELDFTEQKKRPSFREHWMCDSMDGAVQYIQHLPGWTINLVLMRGGEAAFSVIYDPLMRELFHAEAGKGAFLNGQPIGISKKSEHRAAVAAFNHPPFITQMAGVSRRLGSSVERALNLFGAVRNYGPTALQIAWVATGRLDAFFEEGLDTFNWLAGILIAKESGAEILTLQGHPWKWGDDSLLITTKTFAPTLNFLKP